MAVTLDLRDDPNGIHPRYIAYGKQIEFQGPIVKNVVYSNGSGTVNISYTAVSNIELRNPNGFEVCCRGDQCLNDYFWVPSIMITVNSSCVGKQLYGIRYLW